MTEKMNDQQDAINTIRFLSVDAVAKANSGHPGMPLGMAEIGYTLWTKHLKHHPNNPDWFNRDRFVLSNGHGSMLLYALLHLTGYALSIDDIKAFRQLHSKTPGHPEYLETKGVETTTGPLGQGFANAVGMAIAEATLAKRFNRDGFALVHHYTYVFLGDGCLMEGISHEVASLAGVLGLHKLIAFYDDNGISIDGDVTHWFQDDTKARFEAYHWHVLTVAGHDVNEIDAAIIKAKAHTDKPTLIMCKTVIGKGSPKENTAECHGSPLTLDDIASMRETLNYPYQPFEVPNHVYQHMNANDKGQLVEREWLHRLMDYQNEYPDLYDAFLREINGYLPDDWTDFVKTQGHQFASFDKAIATRKASQMALEVIAPLLPHLMGGSADLTGSNNTDWSGSVPISKENMNGNYINYGVREFGMCAIMTGLALHGGIIPYGGTFLVFADYAKNAIRLAALMRQRVVFVLTHDSIGLGEDGPTHQPIEHITMLRFIPNMQVHRPATLLETFYAWTMALSRVEGPSALILSRQALPSFSHHPEHHQGIHQGGYVLKEATHTLNLIIMATGSEVALALSLQSTLEEKGHGVRVVSMPCCEIFLAQSNEYRQHILPKTIKKIAIEAGSTAYWYRFVGESGRVFGVDTFGLSAPIKAVYQAVGLTEAIMLPQIESYLVSE